jgi:hypothetical protein
MVRNRGGNHDSLLLTVVGENLVIPGKLGACVAQIGRTKSSEFVPLHARSRKTELCRGMQ